MFQQISKSANQKMFQQISVAWKGKAAATYSSYSAQCQIRQKGRKMQKWLKTGKLRVASRSRIGSQGKERGESRNKSFPVLHFAGQGPSEEEEQKQKNCNKQGSRSARLSPKSMIHYARKLFKCSIGIVQSFTILETTRWSDDQVTRWPDDQMTRWPDDQMTWWPDDQMTYWPVTR